MFPSVTHGLLYICCCCECASRRRRQRRFRIRLFTPDEEDQLVAAAKGWMKDTGRTCADFFPTMQSGSTADSALAGRPTLLTKVKNLNEADALAASATICARVPLPSKPKPTPVVEAPTFPELNYGVRYYEVSGFGFVRPADRGPYTLDQASGIAEAFRKAHPYPSLEGATVFDLRTM